MAREFDPFVPIVDTPIASFDDQIAESALVKLETAITPVQDLNGYSKPWAAGAGKNKWSAGDQSFNTSKTIALALPAGTYSASAVTTTTAESNTTVIILLDDDNTDLGRFSFTANSGVRVAALASVTIASAATKVTVQASYNYATSNGQDATFTDVQIESGSGTTSFEPYSNVCPITGFTGATVNVTGANIWDEQTKTGYYNSSGTHVSDSTQLCSKNDISVKPSTSYRIISGATGFSGYFFDASGNVLDDFAASGSAKELLITTPADCSFIRINLGTTYGSTYNDDCAILYPSKLDTYNEYDGSAITANWNSAAGTVYDGTWNVLTGVLTSRMVNIASYNGEEINEPWISSMDEYVAGTTPTTGAQVVYTLAEPLTYELTAETVNTLTGYNTIWSTSGNITVYYPIDISYFRRYFMVNSGYILLDGGGIDLTSTDPQLIAGSWDRTVTAMETGKPIWSYNTKYGTGKPLTPVPVFCWYLSATSIVIVGATLHIIVSNTDYCVVQDVASD